MKILERKFRGSVICKALSYPITYAIAKELLEKGPMELDGLVKIVGRAKNTVCTHLGKLRMVNIVRFEKKQRKTIYWIKYPDEVRDFMEVCERLVRRTVAKIERDV